jgi:hypothetical protein
VICGPPIKGTSNELADWLELEALSTDTGAVPVDSVNSCLEIGEDEEPEKLEEENTVEERRLTQVLSAIAERKKAIGKSYPFAVSSSGDVLSLKDSLDHGGYAYLFCLIVSSAAPDGLLSGEGPWVPDLARARTLFQACATIASAGHVVGPAYSVGWPRPDSSPFLVKLNDVYTHFGDGRAHDKRPPGAPPKVKDDEIDVIAWTYNRDMKPRVGYFIGQAASGGNWDGKSLKGRVDRFHGTWFSKPPASQLRVGTIMPFTLPSPADADADDHESQEEIEGKIRLTALDHGDLLHRLRVAYFVTEGAALTAQGIEPIEGLDQFDEVIAYVDAYREQLIEASDAT